MAYKLKPVVCENCRHWHQYGNSSTGECGIDNRVSNAVSVCNLLPTNEDRREAKINLYK